MDKQEVLSVIIGHTREVIPGLKEHTFRDGDSLRELGANSVDRSEIIMMSLETLDLNIPLMELAMAENIDELASILHAKLQVN